MRSTRLLLLAAVLVVAFPASAALQVRQTLASGDGTPPVERKLIVSDTKLRVDEGTWSLIFDSATGKILQLHHAEKTWSESVMPQAAAVDQDPVSSRFAAAFAKSLPLAVEPGTVAVRPIDETRTIAGVPAKRVDVYRDGVLVGRRWHAQSVDDGELVQIQSLLATSPLAPHFSDGIMISTRTGTLGLAVRIEDVESGDSMEAIEIRKDKPAAALFAPPAGYRKVD